MTASVYWFVCTRQAYPAALPRIAADQKSFNRAAANAIAGVMKARRDVGDLVARPVSTAITGHLLCDGSELSRVSFPQLFAVIGEEWGAGDGVSTFNIPNLVGTALPVPPDAPEQVITGTTTGDAAPPPSDDPAVTGGGDGGANTGGRPDRPRSYPGLDLP